MEVAQRRNRAIVGGSLSLALSQISVQSPTNPSSVYIWKCSRGWRRCVSLRCSRGERVRGRKSRSRNASFSLLGNIDAANERVNESGRVERSAREIEQAGEQSSVVRSLWRPKRFGDAKSLDPLYLAFPRSSPRPSILFYTYDFCVVLSAAHRNPFLS